MDAVGIMAKLLKSRGAIIIGYTSAEGYVFETSQAFENDHFVGLAIDTKNQSSLTDERIIQWTKVLKKTFS